MSPKQYGKPQQKNRLPAGGAGELYPHPEGGEKPEPAHQPGGEGEPFHPPVGEPRPRRRNFCRPRRNLFWLGKPGRPSGRKATRWNCQPGRETGCFSGQALCASVWERAEIVSEESLWLKGPESAEKALQELYRLQCRVKAEEYLPEVLEDFADALPGLPTLRYRRMTSRWGSCNTKSRQDCPEHPAGGVPSHRPAGCAVPRSHPPSLPRPFPGVLPAAAAALPQVPGMDGGFEIKRKGELRYD